MHKAARGIRRTRALVISAVVVAAVATAWGAGGKAARASVERPASVAAANASCTGTPVRGGNLVYERQAATETLDPLNPKNGNGDIFTYNQIYSGLVRSDPTGRTNDIVPSLAERWTVTPDGKTYTFYLRP